MDKGRNGRIGAECGNLGVGLIGGREYLLLDIGLLAGSGCDGSRSSATAVFSFSDEVLEPTVLDDSSVKLDADSDSDVLLNSAVDVEAALGSEARLAWSSPLLS